MWVIEAENVGAEECIFRAERGGSLEGSGSDVCSYRTLEGILECPLSRWRARKLDEEELV